MKAQNKKRQRIEADTRRANAVQLKKQHQLEQQEQQQQEARQLRKHLQEVRNEEAKEKQRQLNVVQLLAAAPPPTAQSTHSTQSTELADKGTRKSTSGRKGLSKMPSFLNNYASDDDDNEQQNEQQNDMQNDMQDVLQNDMQDVLQIDQQNEVQNVVQDDLHSMPSFLIGFEADDEQVPPPPPTSDVDSNDDEEREEQEKHHSSEHNTTITSGNTNDSKEWDTQQLALTHAKLRNAQLQTLQDVQTIEYLKAQIATQPHDPPVPTAATTTPPRTTKPPPQPHSPQQERSLRMREDALQNFRENVLYMRTASTTTTRSMPADVTFHTTEEMLLRSRQRVKQELKLSRLRAHAALDSTQERRLERSLENKMMHAHANSTKRYSELHGLYSEAVALRDRYQLSVAVPPRPVMTTGPEHQARHSFLTTERTEGKKETFDLALATNDDLEKYRQWLLSNSSHGLTVKGSSHIY